MGRRAKPKAQAKRPLARKAPKKDAARVHALEKRLAEALAREAATSEVLKVISRSTFDLKPVLDTLIENAARLCDARRGVILRREGDSYHGVAFYNASPELVDFVRRHPITPGRHSVTARVVLERRTIHVADLQADPEYRYALRDVDRIRTELGVPMFRGDDMLGVIILYKLEVQPFTDKQIELVQTFADQAVIAIENVRLFTELQQKNEALAQAHAQVSEALEQQTATSEILRVISQSQTDVQPVFDAIVRNAVRLCGALRGAVYRVEDGMIHFVAHHNFTPEGLEARRRAFPQPLSSPGDPLARMAAEGRVARTSDSEADAAIDQEHLELFRLHGVRSGLNVPMLRDGRVVGSIALGHSDTNAFTDDHIALLQTFADQAVIAIENVRLFTELQTSNRELTTALDTQTATSDILRVISRSQTDVQPVFETIVRNAVGLCDALYGQVFQFDGELIQLVAQHNLPADQAQQWQQVFPQSPAKAGSIGRVITTGVVLHLADVESDNEAGFLPGARGRMRDLGTRSLLMVPIFRRDTVVGAIAMSHREVGAFTDAHVDLLKTFADQAVIAIENARLLTELQARTHELTRSVEQLTALGDVGRAVSSSLDLDTVLTTIVGRAVQLSGTDGGTIFEYDESAEEFVPRATLNANESQSALLRATRLRRGEGAVGQIAVTREPIQIPDIAAEGAYESRLRGALLEAGTRAVLAIPLLHEQRIVGGLVVTRRAPGAFTAEVVEILRTFATQSALAIQNARLFHEIEVKSRELEVASQHKSEFLASMSHELRTPLNAIIGFSDVLLQGMFGETNEKQTEYLRDILASGQHLLSLINDILDLSKIEAGRMELDVAAFDLPSAVDDALLLMRERAGRRGITLERHVDEHVGEIHGDQRKVKQVLLNLLSNAVKFTPEGGRIDVRASLANGTAEISVTDTGIGIAPEDHDAVFEEFRQVGAADKKAEGTGLGLALCRKFVELHGGRIWVKSQVGVGSTFTFSLPRSSAQHG